MSILAEFLVATTVIVVFILLRLLTEQRVAEDRQQRGAGGSKCQRLVCYAHCDLKQEDSDSNADSSDRRA